MRTRGKMLIGLLAALIGYSDPLIATESSNRKLGFKEAEKLRAPIYAHMKRYGINREDIETLRQLDPLDPRPRNVVAKTFPARRAFPD